MSRAHRNHRRTTPNPLLPVIRGAFPGPLIVNSTYYLARADAVAFARLYISNPDLVERFRTGTPLAEADPTTSHGGGAKGYIDYPALQTARRSVVAGE